MEGVPPSFMEDDVNQLDFETFYMPELLLSPPEEIPVNQSSMSCNDQAGQNLLVNINDTIQQTTRFPPSFPQTMMEGAPPSSGEDDVNFTWNQLELDTLISELSLSPLEEVPVNQSSILCNDQVYGDHDLLNSNCYDSTFFEPTSSSRQRQQGHVNMTPNTTTSQHGGFNQPRPSLPAPRAGSRDPFWNYVEEKNDEGMICVFCQRRWAINTSISRIKWHLSGEEGRGVAICRGVTKEVQEEALKAMRGGNKRHKSTASSINVNDRGISTCPQEQNIENENMGGDTGRVLREVQPQHLIFSQPRPKRCVTHCYIARNIHCHQQFIRKNPSGHQQGLPLYSMGLKRSI